MGNEIPSHLGLGIINSVCNNLNEVSAEYTLFGETITKLNIFENNVLIEDFHKGELIGYTSDKDVTCAIVRH